MLRLSLLRACSSRRASPFLSSVGADHISADVVDSAEQQVSVLLDELTRERLLVKSLRVENEALRGNVTTVAQREAELHELDRQIRDQQRTIETYKTRLSEQEIRSNEHRVEFADYRKLVELEKVKLNQARSLPILLAAIGGAAATYLLVRGTIQFEKENAKFLKHELDQMWHARVRDLQAVVEDSQAEIEVLKKQPPVDSGWLSIAGKRLL